MQSTAAMIDLKQFIRSGLGTPILLIALMAMIILPLPAFLLDILFSFNISFALVVLLAAVYCKRPLEFAVFPTILLITTLLRLGLNVASTRVILLDGHTGATAAGQVVESFGEVVIGGNYAVGLVVFAILVIINFVVVTKGAGRVSEVSARFTLDAMPGKQMAIDADLNAGVITQEEAKLRREEVSQESDFYGSMDGASKFVRGDAIAGILILFINIIGGFAIGLLQHDMAMQSAVHNYTLLTIGDGLVAQIPSLLLSTAAAIMVTRVSSAQDMGEQVLTQVFMNPTTLYITAAILGGLGLIPGMPHFVFLLFGGLIGTAAYFVSENKKAELSKSETTLTETPLPEVDSDKKDLDWEDVNIVDSIGIDIGYRLIPLVDEKQQGQLLKRVKGVRKKLSQDLGFLLPTVHIKDNLDLAPQAYQITLYGVPIASGEIFMDKELAIDPGQVYGKIDGIASHDPAFGLDAYWIDSSRKEDAQTKGYTVVDCCTVLATHLNKILLENAAQLLGHDETQMILERLAVNSPKLVEELTPGKLPLGIIVKVLQALLSEGIAIRDMKSIAESLIDSGMKSQDIDFLVSSCRVILGRTIIQKLFDASEELEMITLDSELEQILLQPAQSDGGGFTIEPGLAEKLQQSLCENVKAREMAGKPAVLLVQQVLRPMLSRFALTAVPGLAVLAYQEIPNDKNVKIIGIVGK